MRKVLFILGELNEQDLDWLATSGSPRAIAPGQSIIRQGRVIDSMFIVLRGAFCVAIEGQEDKPLAVLGAGEIVGEMSLVDHGAPSATVRALADSHVLELPRAELELKLKQDVGFAARFHRALAVFLSDRLRSTFQALGDGASISLDEHVLEDREVDPAVLDKVALAGLRFDTMLRRLLPE
ncbi:MAG TPA: cyclic nucleotide-binding domain-containing protein [Pantanalinema sp.]